MLEKGGIDFMIEAIFFVLGLINSLLLIVIFLFRKNRMDLVKRFGWIYLLLGIPAILTIIFAVHEGEMGQYVIFLGIFLVFLLTEWLMDFVLKVDFRTDIRANWKWLIPYLCLYYSMNYGFVIMPWKSNLAWGLVMVFLFVLQIAANIWSHPKKTKSPK
jgi:hypothetical protein